MIAAQQDRRYLPADIIFHLFFLSAISPLHNFGISVEHFPYGILCILFAQRIRVDVVFFTMILLIAFVLSILYYSALNIKIISYLVATFNIMSFLWFVPGNEDRLIRAARNVFWISIAVGLLQFVGALRVVEELIQIFIQRFSGDRVGALRGSYRGVSMLETEPARASIKIILLYIIAYHSFSKPLSKYFVIAIFAQLVLIKSATGIFLSLVAVFLVSMRYPRAQVVMIVMLVLAGPVALSYLMENPKFAIIYKLFQAEGIEGLYKGFVATSGGRALAIVNTFQAIIENPFGYGANPEFFNLEQRSEEERLIAGYRTYVSTRPTALFLNFIYAYGWIPFLILLYFTLNCTRRSEHSILTDPVAWIIIFCGFFYSSASTPLVLVAWVLYSYRSATEEDEKLQPAPRPIVARRAPGVELQT